MLTDAGGEGVTPVMQYFIVTVNLHGLATRGRQTPTPAALYQRVCLLDIFRRLELILVCDFDLRSYLSIPCI